MRRARKLLLTCLVAVAAAVLFSATAHAIEGEAIRPRLAIPIPNVSFSTPAGDGERGTIPWIGQYIRGVYNYAIGIASLLASVMFIIGGFYYLTAGGDSSRVKTGREKIAGAVIGLLLVLGSYVMLETINPELTFTQGINLPFVRRKDALPPPQERERIVEHALVPSSGAGAPGGAPGAAAGPEGAPPISGGAPPGGGTARPGIGSGCGASGMFPNLPPPASSRPCTTAETCHQRFCEEGNMTPPPGTPHCTSSAAGISCTGLVGFDGLMPETIGQQALEKGLTMIMPSGLCAPPPIGRGCELSRLTARTFGPGTSNSMRLLMNGSRIFVPGARDGLVAAGAAAKAEGYFIAIGDAFRTMQTQVTSWCTRRAASGGRNAGGLATPGTSNHQWGLAADLALFKIEGDRYWQVTVVGGVSTQVQIQNQLGGAAPLAKLEQFMAAGNWKHMCEEVWHFDFSGIYGVDCTSCEYPGAMARRAAAER